MVPIIANKGVRCEKAQKRTSGASAECSDPVSSAGLQSAVMSVCQHQ